MTPSAAFGRVLRAQRRKQGLTQEALAFEAELDRTYISLLELGRHAPSLDTMVALASALDVPLSELAHRVEIRLKGRQHGQPESGEGT